MSSLVRGGIAALLALSSGACAHYELHTPSEFVVLEDDGAYSTRALNAQGVVIAMREVENDPRANSAFWLEAIRNQLIQGRGYAVLGARDVHAQSGQKGKLLQLGREQGGEQYTYWLGMFVTKQRLYIVEAGARADRFKEALPAVEKALASLTLRGDPW